MGEREIHSVDFNLVLNEIGGFGSWQFKNFFLLWLTSISAGLGVVVFIFTAHVPKHHCSIPYCPKTENNHNFANLTEEFFPDQCVYKSHESLSIPNNPTTDTCEEYIATITQQWNTTTDVKCTFEDLEFDFSNNVKTSLAIDNRWVCERRVIKDLVGASYMLGMLVGSFVLGIISDKFGRITALMISILLLSFPPIIGSFASGTYIFAFLRFLTGIGGIGCFMVSFVLAVEYVSLKYTILIGISIEIPFAIGELILGAEAYLIRDWVLLQIIAYAPIITLLILWFFLPESPRWLLAIGNEKKAKKIVAKAIEENQKDLSVDDVFSNSRKSNQDLLNKPSLIDLFKPSVIRRRTLNMFYQWFSVTLCYYGLSFTSTSLHGDKYANFMLSVFIEIPAYLLCMLAMDSWGRKPILSLCQATSGICCIIAGLLGVYKNPLVKIFQVVFFLIGKFGASACFAIVYVYTAELYTTSLRNTAIGSCSSFARIGGIISYLIQITEVLWKPLPLLIIGSVSTIAGFMAYAFPETIGNPLPENQTEAINIGKNKRRGFFQCTTPWWLHM